MKIHAETTHYPEFYVHYAYIDEPGAGFMFDCLPDGTIVLDKMCIEGRLNLWACLRGDVNVERIGIVDTSYDSTDYSGMCDICGTLLYMSRYGTTECSHCGREYTQFGQLLALPERDEY